MAETDRFTKVAATGEVPPGEMISVELDGEQVARFSLRTGEVLAPPALVPVKTYEVRVEGEDVLLATADR